MNSNEQACFLSLQWIPPPRAVPSRSNYTSQPPLVLPLSAPLASFLGISELELWLFIPDVWWLVLLLFDPFLRAGFLLDTVLCVLKELLRRLAHDCLPSRDKHIHVTGLARSPELKSLLSGIEILLETGQLSCKSGIFLLKGVCIRDVGVIISCWQSCG